MMQKWTDLVKIKMGKMAKTAKMSMMAKTAKKEMVTALAIVAL